MTDTEMNDPRLAADGNDWILIVDRVLPHGIEAVWAALTEPEQIRSWLPFSPDRALATPGPVQLTDLGMPNPETRQAKIREARRPETLSIEWGGDVLRFELAGDADETRLTLRHRFSAREQAPSYAAGWHLCFGALADLLDGHPGPLVVGEAAMEHGYPELHERYAVLLGIPSEQPAG